MTKRKIAIISLLSGAGLLFAALFFGGVLRARGAALLVESNTPSQVYINNEPRGRTPLNLDLDAGEITLKLVPDAVDKPFMAYETKVKLESGIQTVIRRSLSDQASLSSGEVISFEKIGGKEASVAVVSSPDGADIKIDGENKGSAPLLISDINANVHQLQVSASGFQERSFPIKTVAGYKLTAIVDLATAPQKESTPSQTPAPQASLEPEKKTKQVEILSTPTGFLRVRQEPTTASLEVAQVKPGELYDLIEEDTAKGWFKIAIEEDKTGWVTGDFAKIK